MKKVFCAALVILGITLETYFYAFRFIAEGLPVVVAIATGLALDTLLAFTVYNAKRSKVYVFVAVTITMYAVVQTSAGQTFALLSHTASIGVATESSTASFTIEQCKDNLTRLSDEAKTITAQLNSLQSAEARAQYAGTIAGANRRLAEITRERARLMDMLLKTTSETVADARTEDGKKSIYGFYSSMPGWKSDNWLKFVFHFFLSVLIAIMAPIGILTWDRKIVQTDFTKQQIETFVAGAWYKIRNNSGVNILSEIDYNALLQRRGYTVESGVYFALVNRCAQLGLINSSGYAVVKDHRKVIEKLSGAKTDKWKAAQEKVRALKQQIIGQIRRADA